MADADEALGTKGIDPQLVADAAAQMRRPAPGQEPDPKRRKKGDPDACDGAEAPVPVLTRFAYNARELLQKGARGLLMTTYMRHERGATKETLATMQHYGFADSHFCTVKVACQGLVVILLNEKGVQTQAPPDAPHAKEQGSTEGQQAQQEEEASRSAAPATTAEVQAPVMYEPFQLTQAVHRVIADIENKKRLPTKTVQRIIPLECTSVLEAEELRKQVPLLAAAFKASPLADKFQAMHAEGRKIPFAVGFKNRDFDVNHATWNGAMEGQTWEVYKRTNTKQTDKQQQQQEEGAQVEGKGATAAADAAAGSAEGQGDKASEPAQADAAEGGAAGGEAVASKEEPAKVPNPAAALRQSVIRVLATSLQAALQPWQLDVNLSAPELVLLCEVIPMSGDSTFAGLGLVPADMCRFKSTIQLKGVWAGK